MIFNKKLNSSIMAARFIRQVARVATPVMRTAPFRIAAPAPVFRFASVRAFGAATSEVS